MAFPTNYGYPPFWGQINKLSAEECRQRHDGTVDKKHCNCLSVVCFLLSEVAVESIHLSPSTPKP